LGALGSESSASISMNGIESSSSSFSVTTALGILAHGDREARDALEDVRHALREVDRGRRFSRTANGISRTFLPSR